MSCSTARRYAVARWPGVGSATPLKACSAMMRAWLSGIGRPSTVATTCGSGSGRGEGDGGVIGVTLIDAGGGDGFACGWRWQAPAKAEAAITITAAARCFCFSAGPRSSQGASFGMA